ncbi:MULTISPECIES: HNH endonuclease [unclassified Mycobacterium]|uniref:HNH endonuclease n=1 Tax=unclassified Mycobacterium TaxID=2642494 RepID=UPI00274038E6|nr:MULTISPECIES: HNH endonuclease signature motif containing protein [unclassified Mycobacterium]MDP7703194.1 HNH endonuclease signature motif containing protein [Mycobacterium sp. TY815]MDP7721799.1 HNH endonuclease signature motif containing protein [Mycobacterium sp. TY814]
MPPAWSGPRTASSKITGTRAWRKLRVEVLKRDHNRCQVRGPNCIGHADEVDHDHNVAAGGAKLDPRNARAICEPCHRDKTRGESTRGQSAWKRQPESHPARLHHT